MCKTCKAHAKPKPKTTAKKEEKPAKKKEKK